MFPKFKTSASAPGGPFHRSCANPNDLGRQTAPGIDLHPAAAETLIHFVMHASSACMLLLLRDDTKISGLLCNAGFIQSGRHGQAS